MRPRESALLVPEELAFDQVARDRRHVDGDERALAPLAVVMERARDQFLAGAGLAGDHHREVGLHQSRERTVDLLHRRRAADQRNVVGLIVAGARQRSSAATAPARRWPSAPSGRRASADIRRRRAQRP